MALPDRLSKYEREQVKSINDWKDKEPSVASQVFGAAAKPAILIAQMVIPDVAIQGVLNAANWAAHSLSDTKDIERDGGVTKISDLKLKNLELSDDLSDEVHNWASQSQS